MAAYTVPLRRHRVITHLIVAVTAIAVAVGIAIPTAPIIQAGLQTAPREGSILPANVGIGVGATDAVVLDFPGPMDRAAVGAALGLAPRSDVNLLWNADASAVALVPSPRWAVDERYVIYLPVGTRMADGGVLATAWRASFTTQLAPHVERLSVGGVTGTAAADTPVVLQELMASTGTPETDPSAAADDAAPDTSADTRIGLTFSAAMDRPRTEAAFRISPAIGGSFQWEGTTLWFLPNQRLAAGTRYVVAVVGARDGEGSPVGGDTSFSFTTRDDAQAVTVAPAIGAGGVPTTTSVQIRFSQPMAQAPTGAALRMVDGSIGGQVEGGITWSADGTTLNFVPASTLAAGHTYTVSLAAGARDADGNPVTTSWRFTTAGPGPVRSFSPVPASPGSANMVQYALNQINAARASYGLGPLVVDSAISAVAYGHAADMLAYGYLSHTSRTGLTYKQRLSAGGISYGWSGENLCYLGYGGGVQGTLDWCHAQFWAEPYPGGGNHKDNILSPHFRRVGIGIAAGGNNVYVAWDFTD